MPEHRNRIFVSIGVSRPDGGLAPLDGAITASERMAAWADANGYIPVIINDAIYPAVTIDLLRDTITAAIEEVTKRDVLQRLIIFFAGHGASLGIDDQNWLLSKWKQRSSEVVSIAALLRALEYHGPQQVTIIGDACQEFSSTFMEVVGGPVLDTTDEHKRGFELDKFFPVDAGSKAFMIKAKGADKAFCLFSEVMLDALEGDAPAKYFETDGNGRHVTSQKIAQYLMDHLEIEAGKHGVSMSPRPRPGFWSDRAYFSAANPDTGGPPVGVAPESAVAAKGNGAKSLPAVRPRSVERVRLTPDLAAADAAQQATAQLESQRLEEQQNYAAAANVEVRNHFETGCGICFTGALVEKVQASRGIVSQVEFMPDWYRFSLSDEHDRLLWADVVVDLPSGSIASACVVQNFVTAMHVFDHGGVNVLHRPIYAEAHEGEDVIDLLAGLHAGTLTASQIVDAAAMLRMGKHRVLTLGVIAAQFYDSVRDTDGLRSIAWFYAEEGRPIPLDIVLYGGGRLFAQDDMLLADIPATAQRQPRTEIERERGYTFCATPAITQHPVAGRVPWMRQAWGAITTAECDDSAAEWRQQALAVLPHLGAGPFTVVGAGGRDALITLCGITETDKDPEPAVANG